jgi:hypothetical protein
MPTTTSLLAFLAQGLRVAASFNRPITSALDQINANGHFSFELVSLEFR